MCTISNDKNMKRPISKTFTAYKVFGKDKKDKPYNFLAFRKFKIGTNKWNKKLAKKDNNKQKGFQVFKNMKDALEYGPHDFVAKVLIETKNIEKAGYTNKYITTKPYQAYEVKEFKLTKKNWENRIKG